MKCNPEKKKYKNDQWICKTIFNFANNFKCKNPVLIWENGPSYTAENVNWTNFHKGQLAISIKVLNLIYNFCGL